MFKAKDSLEACAYQVLACCCACCTRAPGIMESFHRV